jgi:ribosome maturation factor RimP
MLDKDQLSKIEIKIKPIIDKFKLSLYELSYVKDHGVYILRVLLDNEQEDIDVNTCADVSEAISPELDKFKFLDDEYLLEVASVGIERPIKGLGEFNKHLNKYIEIVVKEPVLNFRELIGTLMAVEGEEISLKINIKGRIKVVKIMFKNIVSAQTAVKF